MIVYVGGGYVLQASARRPTKFDAPSLERKKKPTCRRANGEKLMTIAFGPRHITHSLILWATHFAIYELHQRPRHRHSPKNRSHKRITQIYDCFQSRLQRCFVTNTRLPPDFILFCTRERKSRKVNKSKDLPNGLSLLHV